jgi:hypothetical protein
MARMIAFHLSVLLAFLFALALPESAYADQCDDLKALIARLQQQRDAAANNLSSDLCSGPSRSVCMARVRSLDDQIRAELAVLKTCRGGVIPTSGIPAPPVHRPFDLHPRQAGDVYTAASGLSTNDRWDSMNGIPKNPLWAAQLYDGVLPDPIHQCGASGWSYHASDWAGCTADAVWTNHDKCAGGGHVNWQPVTYEGFLLWQDHSGGDDDYNIRMTRPDNALYNSSSTDHILLEFDSDETIDPFSDRHPWWRQFRSAVDRGDKDPGGFNNTWGTAIGLLGLDYEHDSHTELHPVYALTLMYGRTNGHFLRAIGAMKVTAVKD